jgi:uncharacterized membrane protein
MLFVGRFHPLLVHLPIGGLIVAALLAIASRARHFQRARAALFPVLLISAVGAVLAVGAGQALSTSGAFAGATFAWHRALGYLIALVTMLAAASTYAEVSVDGSGAFRRSNGLIGACVLMLLVAGHLGGTMTRGSGYLTEHLPRTLRTWWPGGAESGRLHEPVQPGQVVVYTALVAPILSDRCVSCHGPDNESGGLRLDTPDHIRAGGSTGRVIAAGQAASSELLRRIWLPVTHEDAMPPRGRQPITVAEASLLRWWVDSGASFDRTLADLDIDDEVRPAIEARVGTLLTGAAAVLAMDVPPVDAAALADLIRRGLPVSRLTEEVSLLQVQARGMGRAFGDAEMDALLPVAPHVTWIDLGGTAVTDRALTIVARLPHLSRLHLDRTAVTDEGLQAVKGLEHLEYLNLYGTSITDAGIDVLAALPRLRAVYLWQTKVSDAGIARLRATRPALQITTGLHAE